MCPRCRRLHLMMITSASSLNELSEKCVASDTKLGVEDAGMHEHRQTHRRFEARSSIFGAAFEREVVQASGCVHGLTHSLASNAMENGVPADSMGDVVRTLEEPGQSQKVSVLPVRPHLFLVLECDRPWAGGARFEVSGLDEVVIGRGPKRAATRLSDRHVRRLQVTVPARTMSNVHARLRANGADWVLEDAGSTNGCFMNGRMVTSAVVGDGDCLELGHTLFTLRLAVPTPNATPETFDSLEEPLSVRGFATLQPWLAAAFAEIVTVARSPLAVVLTGKSGTGKEVIARAIHASSCRSGPFVAVNCGALTPNLIESQFFGHVRGAFSGAVRDELGFVRSAHRGTLFLDEVGELPHSAQTALLRVLQESEVVPVGSARPTNVDIRVVAGRQASAARGPLRQARGLFCSTPEAR